jgi:hypothetical protein
MSDEDVSKGLEFIEAAAKRFDLSLGSRHEDFSRGSIRLSLEKTVEVGGRRLLRSPVCELSREFVRDLPSESRYKDACVTFLQSLSLRLLHPKPNQFITLSGVPVEAEIRWPFRPVQDADDFFVHVFVKIASPFPEEAHFTGIVRGQDRIRIGPSLSPPMVECLTINSIRSAIDKGLAKFYPFGAHPSVLQRVQIAPPASDQTGPDDGEVHQFIKRKTYWLGFREGDDKTFTSINDPYDCHYLVRSAQRLKQIARVLSATSSIRLDPSGQYTQATDNLLAESIEYEKGLADFLERTQRVTDPGNAGTSDTSYASTVFISYNTDDAPFANALARNLRSRSIRPWIDEEEIRVGDSLIGRIGEALRDNDFIIVVLSPSSVRSEWLRRELKEALTREISEKRVVVLPVIARTCKIPPFLTDKKYADFTRNSDVALDALVRAIQMHRPLVHR